MACPQADALKDVLASAGPTSRRRIFQAAPERRLCKATPRPEWFSAREPDITRFVL
jgi:hypothetical protein